MNEDTLLKSGITLAIAGLFIGTSVASIVETIPVEDKTVESNRCFSSSETFDSLIEILMKIGHMPSLSCCIIKDNEIVWAKGYGYYDIEHQKLATENTIYMIASISKTITASALMQLYDEGKFRLDDDVNGYLPFSLRNPNYPDDPITFRMLLAHQSSLAEDPSNIFHQHFVGDCPIPLYPWLETYLVPGGDNYTSEVWSEDRPGEKFHYANVGYALIGYLVERISGIPFDKYCMDNIFAPLGMFNTSFRLSDIDVEKVAIPYRFFLGRFIPYEHYGYIGYPAGSVRTSVVELSNFVIAHLNGGSYRGIRILEEETVELMHTAQYPNGQYGLGWVVWNTSDGEEYIGHTGGDLGVATILTIRLSDGVAVMFFVNKTPTRFLEFRIFYLINDLLFWKADNLS
jgi:CubicO group peptidase (beta-lactamase class C family)